MAGNKAGVFSEKVWQAVRRIPRGRVATYGSVAAALGRPGACRAVGQALKRNPNAPAVPCHRVVRSDGRLGGFRGKDTASRKAVLLACEGIEIRGNRIDLERYGCRLYLKKT